MSDEVKCEARFSGEQDFFTHARGGRSWLCIFFLRRRLILSCFFL
jgi:hypothetical protein